jgi:hypothetical protein
MILMRRLGERTREFFIDLDSFENSIGRRRRPSPPDPPAPAFPFAEGLLEFLSAD